MTHAVVTHDAIVLAGGTGRRMGGVLKPQVTVGGRRLLDHVLEATTGARRVVVVAPAAVPLPDGVLRTLEDPPHGGPVAGIAAGLQALGEGPAPVVLVLACDLPAAASAVPRLLTAAAPPPPPEAAPPAESRVPRTTPPAESRVPRTGSGTGGRLGGAGGVDGVVLRDAGGRDQWLLALYDTATLQGRVEALDQAGGLRGAPVRELVRPLRLRAVAARGDEAHDVDTWADRDAISP